VRGKPLLSTDTAGGRGARILTIAIRCHAGSTTVVHGRVRSATVRVRSDALFVNRRHSTQLVSNASTVFINRAASRPG